MNNLLKAERHQRAASSQIFPSSLINFYIRRIFFSIISPLLFLNKYFSTKTFTLKWNAASLRFLDFDKTRQKSKSFWQYIPYFDISYTIKAKTSISLRTFPFMRHIWMLLQNKRTFVKRRIFNLERNSTYFWFGMLRWDNCKC